MTTITRLVLLLPIDQIRSQERVKQEVEKSATVDVTMSAYAKSRIVEGIFMTLGTGDTYQPLSTYCSFNYARILIETGQILVGNEAFRI